MSDRDVTVAPDDYTAKLMAEVERLQGENAKLLHQGARLFDKTLDLADENHKLRERITTQKQTIQAYRDESREWREVAEHAQAENAKLRELAIWEYALLCHERQCGSWCSASVLDATCDDYDCERMTCTSWQTACASWESRWANELLPIFGGRRLRL